MRCPIEDCPAGVPMAQLVCRRHWRLVPADLKRLVYATWNDRLARKEGATEAHQAAKARAIAAIEKRIREGAA